MTVSDREWQAMGRARDLALLGPRGINPQVGAIVLSPTGDVLAEGWHRGAGTPHAEVDALSRLAPGAARGATMVVTLEPCNHTGRTGPCALALIEAGVARVVYSVEDPAEVSGGGAERLRAHGIEVEPGVRADEIRTMIAGWLDASRRGRPHVSIKWAQSLDGRAAAADGSSRWITGPDARRDVHRRRADADAIVAGIGTILADDPALTARADDGSLLPAQPLPVVLGRREVPADAAVRRHPRELLHLDGTDLADALSQLRRRGIQRVFVEGGPTLAASFVRAGLADELLVYVSPILLGGPRVALDDVGVGSIAAARRFAFTDVRPLGADVLFTAVPADAPASDPSPQGGR